MMNKIIVEDINVIVIKLPFDLQSRLLSFPFLHVINERFPEAEIHFITPKKQIEVLNLLPFKAFYHEIEEDEIKTIFDVHRYTVNSKIYKVNLFINLTNSFLDSCIGLSLQAKHRLGFSDGWKTLTLNHRVPRLSGHHLCEDYFSLLKEVFPDLTTDGLKVISRDLPPIITDEDNSPYIAINLSPLRNVTIEEEFVDLISSFEKQKIVLFASDDQDKVQAIIEPFLAKLPKKNTYINFVYKSYIDLAKMLSYSRGVITYEGALASFSAYTGTRTFVIYDREDPRTTGPFYYSAEILIHQISVIDVQGDLSGVLQRRPIPDMLQVFEKASVFFRI